MQHPPANLQVPGTPDSQRPQSLRPSPDSLVELELNTPTANTQSNPSGQTAQGTLMIMDVMHLIVHLAL